MKKVVSLVISFMLCTAMAFADNGHASIYKNTWESSDSVLFQVGEELTYNVSYTFIDIGQVRIKIVDKKTENGKTTYSAAAYIDSYKGVPFVDLHTVYETVMNTPVYSGYFRGRTKNNDSGKWYHITYNFDYTKRKATIQEGEYGSTVINKEQSMNLDTLYQDGLSLFFFARANVKNKKSIIVPTIVQEQKVNTELNFLNERSSEEIDAVDYPVDVIHFDGHADFVGIFGLTGDFEGWFSNDEAAIPIVAKMKVLIGNVRMELMKWNRKGWTPPRGED